MLLLVLLNASGARAATGYSLTDLTNGQDTAKHAVTAAQAEAVNDLGDVVGEASFADSLTTGGELEGFLYKGGVFHELHGDPPQGTAGPRTVALDINDTDDVVGTSYLGFSTTGGNASRMVFWPKGADPAIDPGVLPNGLDQVAGTALNASGTIIGYANDSNLRSQAVESVRGGPLTALTNTTTGFYFGAGISDAGTTALILDSGGGGIGTNTVGSTTLGFRLAGFHALSHNGSYAIGDDSSGVGQELTPLGTITLSPLAGDTSSTPLGVNDSGDAVGFSESQSAVIRAVIWHNGQPTDLNTLVPNLPYPLVEAKDISDTGYIVGDGTGDTVNIGPVWELAPRGGAISGTLTDPSGKPVPGVQVNVTGTDDQGNLVDQHAFSDIDGNYQVSLAPGNYVVAPVQPSDPTQGVFVPTTCSGTSTLDGTLPGCKVALNPGEQATASFKLDKLVVNSAEEGTDETEVKLGVCDVTPGRAVQTCTLPQAIFTADALGGALITFDIPGGGVPVIKVDRLLLDVTRPMVIDGTTEPGSHEVAVMGVGHSSQSFELESPGVTLRGLTISGFPVSDVSMYAGGDTLEQDRLGTVDSSENPIAGVVWAPNESAEGNVIQGNTIGGGGTHKGLQGLLHLHGDHDTIGGALPGTGNVFKDGFVDVRGDGEVIQGNKFDEVQNLVVGDHDTVGGPTPVPGTGAGNDLNDSPLELGSGDVVQGNHIHNAFLSGIFVQGDGNTIGGAGPQMGNLIDQNAYAGVLFDAGITIGHPAEALTPNGVFVPAVSSSGNVIERNRITDNRDDGGVAVYAGAGNHIFENTLTGNTVGINLGGGPYRYDALGFFDSGPNHYQPYPQLLDASQHGSTVTILAKLTTGLLHAQETYTIDVYALSGGRCEDAISEGQGEWLTSGQIRTDGVGTVRFNFALAPGKATSFSETATAPDGSTSEISPCLTLGHKAPSFTATGVSVPGSIVIVTSTSDATDIGAGVAAASKRKWSARLSAIVHPFCPPVTTGYCAGTIVIRMASNRRTIARLKFKLAPGQLGTLTFPLSRTVTKLLERGHRIRLTATIAAHDHAKRAHRKTETERLILEFTRTG